MPRGRHHRSLDRPQGHRDATRTGPAGKGPPRSCELVEGTVGYHDGAGLCSPGRWDHNARILPSWSTLRIDFAIAVEQSMGGAGALERRAFELAVGKAKGDPDPAEPSDLFGPTVLDAVRSSFGK